MFCKERKGNQIVIKTNKFSVKYNKRNPNYFDVGFKTFSQRFFIPASCDSLNEYDLNLPISGFQIKELQGVFRLIFHYRSNLWNKTYYLDVYPERIEFYYRLRGSQPVDTLRFFEGIFNSGFSHHFYLTKHFNDRQTTEYRSYSQASPVSFKKVFNPEPNTYNKQVFNFFDYSQISANSDLDYCGGNFIFNPGILCFLISKKTETEWVSLGLDVKQGEYYFSEYEYFGGEEFGLNLNYWGNFEPRRGFQSPKIIIIAGGNKNDLLREYVSTIVSNSSLRLEDKTEEAWWKGPIICGWGHQCYKADLFRVRSPKDRPKDSSAYFMCSQAHYQEFVDAIDSHGLDWKILIIDSKWTISSGLKEIDVGRWQNMKAFVKKLHERGKRVLIWWGLWDTEGLEAAECITYSSSIAGNKINRPGRFAKFGNLSDGGKVAPDPTLSSFRFKIARSLKNLLGDGEGNLNLDGLKIDHVAATPGIYGLNFPPGSSKKCGIELLKQYQKYIYDTAKAIKSDSLIIGQSANPYFADCTDMIRLGDIYPINQNNINKQMIFRAEMAQIANPGWICDMDNWPIPSLKAFREYMSVQTAYGVPSLYYATHLDTTGEEIPAEDFKYLRILWEKYLRDVNK